MNNHRESQQLAYSQSHGQTLSEIHTPNGIKYPTYVILNKRKLDH